jgi:hypothetical protein
MGAKKNMKKLTALLAIIMIWPAVARAQTSIYPPYPGEGEAWLERYQYNRGIREQEKEKKKQWDGYARKHAIPIARPNEAPSDESAISEKAPGNSGPTNMQPQGIKVIHPPETTSSIASDKTPDLAEPLSFDGPPPKRRARGLW